MGFGAVGDEGGGEAEVRGVESEDALDVREHEDVGVVGEGFIISAVGVRLGKVGGCSCGTGMRWGGRIDFRWEIRRGYGFVGDDMEKGLRSDDSAHAMANKNGADTGVYSWRRGGGGDLEIDDYILKPARGVSKPTSKCRAEGHCCIH